MHDSSHITLVLGESLVNVVGDVLLYDDVLYTHSEAFLQ